MTTSPAEPGRRLVGESLAYATGDVLALLANLGIYILLLRRLSPADFGAYGTVAAVMSWLFPAAQAGLVVAGARILAGDPPGILGSLMRVRWMITGGLIGVLMIAACVVPADLSLTLVAATAWLGVQSLHLEFIWIARRRSRQFAVFKVVASLASLGLIAWLLPARIDPWMVPLALAAGQALGVGLEWLARPVEVPSTQPPWSHARILRFVWPAIAGLTLQLGYLNIDVIVLAFLRSDLRVETGVYAAASKMLQLGTIPFVALQMAFAPRLAEALALGDRAGLAALLRRSRALGAGLGVIGAAAIVSALPMVMTWMAGRELPGIAGIRWWLAAGYALAGMHWVLTAGAFAAGAGRAFVIMHGIAFVTVAGVAGLLCPWWGAEGSAIALFGGHAVLVAASLILGRRLRVDG